MKLKYTNLTGLLAILGFVASLIAIGILYPVHPLLTIPFVLLATGSAIIFVKFVYHFINYHPLGEVTDEEAKAFFRDEED